LVIPNAFERFEDQPTNENVPLGLSEALGTENDLPNVRSKAPLTTLV
jgi:hypothetical protein